jgi:hypothetical protein
LVQENGDDLQETVELLFASKVDPDFF